MIIKFFRTPRPTTPRLHAIRVFLLVMALAGAVWYGKLGNNPFAVTRIVRLADNSGAYEVEFLVITGAGAGISKDTTRAEVSRNEVFPLGGSDGVKAVLTEFAGALVMMADSSVLAVSEGTPRPLFYERLDLLIIPPADETTAKAVRDLFRPRVLAVTPPCSFTPTQNIACADGDFTVKRGKISK